MEIISVILIILGIALLIAEIFIPSFGFTGILGILSILGGILISAKSVGEAVIMFVVIFIVALILMYITYKLIASKKSRLILKDSVHVPVPKSDLKELLMKEGTAITTLRPSGKADFDGVKLDVLTEGDFIKKGSKVLVSSVVGKKIFVKEKEESEVNE